MQTVVPGVPKKVLLFEKSPKFGFKTFPKIFFFVPSANGPRMFGDDKNFFFGT